MQKNTNPIELQVGVKVLLTNSQGKHLLLRRNPKKYPEVGAKWDIVGGRIDPGTDLITNLKREVKEETKLILKDKPKLIAAQDILRIPGRHVVRLTYTSKIQGKPVLDGDHDEYKWFSIEEIKALSSKELDIYFKELVDNKTIK